MHSCNVLNVLESWILANVEALVGWNKISTMMEQDNPMNVSVILAMANSLGGPNPFLPRISTAPITAEIPPDHTKQNKITSETDSGFKLNP